MQRDESFHLGTPQPTVRNSVIKPTIVNTRFPRKLLSIEEIINLAYAGIKTTLSKLRYKSLYCVISL